MSGNAAKRALARLFKDQNGLCCYCDGATWLAHVENREAARRRLGIVAGELGAGRALTSSRASRQHLVRQADGGKNANNLKMACLFCNACRGESTPQEHRADMQRMVAAGIHPTNRSPAYPATTRRRALKVLRQMRAGIEPTQPGESQ